MQVHQAFFFIVYCYARIGWPAFNSFKSMSKWKSTNPQKRPFGLSTLMMCIVFMFFLGTFPYFVLNLIEKEFESPIHHIWTTLLGWLLYCLNPVVYTIMDNNFRTAFRRFLTVDCESGIRASLFQKLLPCSILKLTTKSRKVFDTVLYVYLKTSNVAVIQFLISVKLIS